MRAFWRTYDAVVNGLAWISGFLLAAVFIAVLMTVSMRLAGLREPAWIFPIIENSMLYVGLPPSLRAWSDRVAYLFGFLICLLLAGSTVPVIIETWGETINTGAISLVLHKTWLLVPVTVSMFFIALGFLRMLQGHGSLYGDKRQPAEL
jgi:TRAP-type C4-dicarboxylate transport system permease small subunit